MKKKKEKEKEKEREFILRHVMYTRILDIGFFTFLFYP